MIMQTRQWWQIPLILAFKRHRQMHLCEFEVSLVNRTSSRTARATQRDRVWKSRKQKKRKKNELTIALTSSVGIIKLTGTVISFSFFFGFQDKLSLCSPGCAETHSVKQAGCKLKRFTCLCSQSAGIKGVLTMLTKLRNRLLC